MSKQEETLPQDILQLAQSIVDENEQGNHSLVAHQATVLSVLVHGLIAQATSSSYQDIQAQLAGKDVVRDVEEMLRGVS